MHWRPLVWAKSRANRTSFWVSSKCHVVLHFLHFWPLELEESVLYQKAIPFSWNKDFKCISQFSQTQTAIIYEGDEDTVERNGGLSIGDNGEIWPFLESSLSYSVMMAPVSFHQYIVWASLCHFLAFSLQKPLNFRIFDYHHHACKMSCECFSRPMWVSKLLPLSSKMQKRNSTASSCEGFGQPRSYALTSTKSFPSLSNTANPRLMKNGLR